MITETLTPHPYAACYPLVSGTLEESLYESIKVNGLRQPIVLWRDEARDKTWLIDGRNRYRALRQLHGGISEEQVTWRDYESDEAVRLAVLDYNENRRQMSTAQKSVVAGRIIEARAQLLTELNALSADSGESAAHTESVECIEQIEASNMDKAQASQLGDEQDLPPFDTEDSPTEVTLARSTVSTPKKTECPPEIRREVASTLGIGPKTAQRGAVVVGRGAPKLVDALEEGLVSVEAAYTLTQLDDDELDAVVAQGKEVMREKARELKGAEKAAREEKKQNAILGDIEVEKLVLSWTEKQGTESQSYNLEIEDPHHLTKLLMMLTKLGLRGKTDEASVETSVSVEVFESEKEESLNTESKNAE